MKMMANQNTGIDTPDTAIAITAVSAGRPRLSAAQTPAGMPTPSANVIANRLSSSVAGKRVTRLWATGMRLKMERPRSPLSRSRM